MPLYEYRCRKCRKRFTALVGVVADASAAACPDCGSGELDRLMSRFGSVRSEDQVLDDLADESAVGDLDDPKTVRKWAREMSKSLGDDEMAGDLEELMDAEEAGEATDSTPPDETIY